MMPGATGKPSGISVAASLARADASAKASPTASASVSAIHPCAASAMKIVGTTVFVTKTEAALKEIAATKSGAALLADLESSGKIITIEQTSNGNSLTGLTAAALAKPGGAPNVGSDSTVKFNPGRTSIGSEPWETRPPAIGLAHELVHASPAARGTISMTLEDNDSRPDPAHPTRMVQEKHEEVRTVGIPPYDKETYSEHSLRSEWPTRQPPRPYY